MQSMRHERVVRISGVVAATALASCVASATQAQTINTNTPVSVSTAGNADRFYILPVITTVYDSNVLRTNDAQSTGPRDNFRISPGASVGLNRLLGRTRVSLAGTVSYDFNTRFSQLNRERINLASQVTTPVGSPCSVSGSAAFEQAQFDLNDTNTPIGASYRRQTYDLSAACNRLAGFYPTVGASYTSTSNSSLKALDTNQTGVRAGLGYSRPSLGTVQLLASLAKISRPGIKDLLGISDSTTISSAQVIISRAVAPRVSFRLGAGITHANPARANVADFTGLSFDGQVVIRPIPRFSIVGIARREIQNQSGYSATYIILDTYRIAGSYGLSARSSATLYAQQLHRDPRGQDLLQAIQPRGDDTLQLVGGDYSFDFHKSLRLTLSVTHLRRTGDNTFYNYKAMTTSAGISARF